MPQSTSAVVEITGVLIDPSLSCTQVANSDANTEDVIRTLAQELTITYNKVVQPPSPIRVAPDDIIGLESPNIVSGKLVSTLPLRTRSKFTAAFQMPDKHSYHDIVMTKKAHQADLRNCRVALHDCKADVRAEHFMHEEALEQASKLQAALDRSVDISMMEALEAKLMNQLNDFHTQQNDKIEYQNDKIEYQNDKIKRLEVSLEHYSAVVRVLHRRVVLDDARSLLSTRYSFPLTSLRPGYQEANGQPTKNLAQLVQEVRLRLNQDDARLLPDEALRMIFDSAYGTVRGEANKVAHRASAEDLVLAITADDLTALQAKTLQDIYKFTHHKIP